MWGLDVFKSSCLYGWRIWLLYHWLIVFLRNLQVNALILALSGWCLCLKLSLGFEVLILMSLLPWVGIGDWSCKEVRKFVCLFIWWFIFLWELAPCNTSAYCPGTVDIYLQNSVRYLVFEIWKCRWSNVCSKWRHAFEFSVQVQRGHRTQDTRPVEQAECKCVHLPVYELIYTQVWQT